MTDLWDYESRLETTTRADSGSYDQVIALSQGIINENFRKLYEMYEGQLNKCYFEHPRIGKIDALVDAPTIIIPGADKSSANLNFVQFQLKFLSGSLVDNADEPLISDLSGWTFSVSVPIVPDVLPDPKTVSDPVKRKEVENILDQFKKNFDHPGDYSIERLYAKLSAAKWHDLDYDTSYAVPDARTKERVPYARWQSSHEDEADALEFWLKKWAREQDKNGLNSIGVSFKDLEQKPRQGRFVPTSLVHQVHTYKSQKNGYPKGKTGLDAVGDCNCLAYLEMVDNHPNPADPRLIWSGNFATQPRAGNNKGIQGTYLLCHDIFMKEILLPEFRALNRASDITHEPLSFYVDTDQRSHININYSVGSDPDHPTDSDGAYDFKPTTDLLEPRKVTGYRWAKTNKQGKNGPVIQKQVSNTMTCWGKAWTEDVMETAVSWTSGGNAVKIEGKAVSNENCRWSPWGTEDFESSQSYFHDVYTLTWVITLNIVSGVQEEPGTQGKCKMSVLDILIDDGPASNKGNINVSVKKNQKGVTMYCHDTILEGYLRKRMADQLPRIIGNIREKLKTSGRFMYPGNGKLIFENPVIGKYGDLNAQVRFQELKHDEWIRVPGAPTVVPETPVKHKITPVKFGPKASELELEWSWNKLAPLTPSSKLQIRAVNKRMRPVVFSEIAVYFYAAGTNPKCLFKTKDFQAVAINKASAEGNVTINRSEALSCDLAVRKLIKGADYVQWAITIRGVNGQPLTVAPGAWLELDIFGETLAAAEYKILLSEAFVNEKGEITGNFVGTSEVTVG